MKTSTVETLTWLLIYGGLVVMGLGITVAGNAAILGHTMTVIGIVAAVSGVALILVRSRMEPPAKKEK